MITNRSIDSKWSSLFGFFRLPNNNNNNKFYDSKKSIDFRFMIWLFKRRKKNNKNRFLDKHPLFVLCCGNISHMRIFNVDKIKKIKTGNHHFTGNNLRWEFTQRNSKSKIKMKLYNVISITIFTWKKFFEIQGPFIQLKVGYIERKTHIINNFVFWTIFRLFSTDFPG